MLAQERQQSTAAALAGEDVDQRLVSGEVGDGSEAAQVLARPEALLAEADATPDDAARYALLGQVQEQITADAANVWLFLLPSLSVIKDGITGYNPNQPGLGLDLTQLAFNP